MSRHRMKWGRLSDSWKLHVDLTTRRKPQPGKTPIVFNKRGGGLPHSRSGKRKVVPTLSRSATEFDNWLREQPDGGE